MASWIVPRFAFCNVPPLPCPQCGASDFGTSSVTALRLSWGLAVAQQPVPGFDYEVGDQIRWRSCLDGTILPWTFFRDGSVNIGDPEIPDVVVIDDWPSQRCPACGTAIGGGAVEITGGRITAARLFLDGEFGDDGLEIIPRMLPDGSMVPLPEAVAYRRATAACAPLEEIEDIPKAVVAVLLPPPSRQLIRWNSLPPAWTDVVEQWLAGNGEEAVSAAAQGTEVKIAPSGVGQFAGNHSDGTFGGATFLSGDPRSQCRAAVMRHWRTAAELILAGGGPDADVAALADELRDLVDRLAPEVAYAYVSIEATFASVVTHSQLSDESVFSDDGKYRPRYMVNEACDEVVLDAYHHQVLGPGHLACLGQPPSGSRALAAGRVSLTLGSPSDWEPATPGRAALRDRGRALLGPLMLDQDQMKELIEPPSPEEMRQLLPNFPWPPTS